MDRAQGLKRLTLRAAFVALFFLLGPALTGEAAAQRVVVEVAPVVTRGEPMLTAALRQHLAREIRKSLAGVYKGPLRVRIVDAKFMRDPGFGMIQRADYLEGFVMLPGRDPERIRLTLPFDRSLFSFTPQGEAVRMRNLIEVFAQWVAKYS